MEKSITALKRQIKDTPLYIFNYVEEKHHNLSFIVTDISEQLNKHLENNTISNREFKQLRNISEDLISEIPSFFDKTTLLTKEDYQNIQLMIGANDSEYLIYFSTRIGFEGKKLQLFINELNAIPLLKKEDFKYRYRHTDDDFPQKKYFLSYIFWVMGARKVIKMPIMVNVSINTKKVEFIVKVIKYCSS